MSKKIYINENSISSMKGGNLLPKFLYNMVKSHTTSLGDNEAFPSGDDFPFDYAILKKRFSQVCDAIDELGIRTKSEDYLMSELSRLIKECKELEKPIRDSLEKICENAVNRLFAIPKESINLTCKLVDKVKFSRSVRVMPESNDEIKYTFADISDIDVSKKAVGKRRFINSLIQGACYTYSRYEELYGEDINKINPNLLNLYRDIITINDYLLFTKKEEMSDEKPMQGSYVETTLGSDGRRTTINSQGVIFPLLLHDTIRGFFELFSSHGLPSDVSKAKYIIRKSDFVLAEPWDMRFGVELWDMIFGDVEDTNAIPYMFTRLIECPTNEFNLLCKEILSGTEKGSQIKQELLSKATYDNDYQAFTNRINARNVDKSLIADSYFTASELDGLELDDNQDVEVIEEEGDDENDNIEKFYRGVGGVFDITNFGIEKQKKCTWLTDSVYMAQDYANEYDDGHLYEISVDMSKVNLYDWYSEADDYFDPYDGFSEEAQEELMNNGFNGYYFALDEGGVLVLFENSPIINVKEIDIDDDSEII